MYGMVWDTPVYSSSGGSYPIYTSYVAIITLCTCKYTTSCTLKYETLIIALQNTSTLGIKRNRKTEPRVLTHMMARFSARRTRLIHFSKSIIYEEGCRALKSV